MPLKPHPTCLYAANQENSQPADIKPICLSLAGKQELAMSPAAGCGSQVAPPAAAARPAPAHLTTRGHGRGTARQLEFCRDEMWCAADRGFAISAFPGYMLCFSNPQ